MKREGKCISSCDYCALPFYNCQFALVEAKHTRSTNLILIKSGKNKCPGPGSNWWPPDCPRVLWDRRANQLRHRGMRHWQKFNYIILKFLNVTNLCLFSFWMVFVWDALGGGGTWSRVSLAQRNGGLLIWMGLPDFWYPGPQLGYLLLPGCWGLSRTSSMTVMRSTTTGSRCIIYSTDMGSKPGSTGRCAASQNNLNWWMLMPYAGHVGP